jgi:hypothetical protein
LKLFQSFVPQADSVDARTTETVEFIDQGGNFERVVCPACSAEIPIGWWQDAMDEAYEGHFENLEVTTPCCQTMTTLNDLQYEWPAGFGRFCLEAMNPNIFPFPREQVDNLAQILGCELRVIWAHL